MAEIIRRSILSNKVCTLLTSQFSRSYCNQYSEVRRTFPSNKEINGKSIWMKPCKRERTKDKPVQRTFEDDLQNIRHKGYLRNQLPYMPPKDVTVRIMSISQKTFDNIEDLYKFNCMKSKFILLEKCAEEFNHRVPNSLVHKMTGIDELIHFYETEVSTLTPLDRMKTMKLPENLHVQYDYHRFHPETDTLYGGITAFPHSSTVVTGLKERKKYQGYSQKNIWAEFCARDF